MPSPVPVNYAAGPVLVAWLLLLFYVMILLPITYLVYRDAKKHSGGSPFRWALVVFFAPLVGLLVYLVEGSGIFPPQPGVESQPRFSGVSVTFETLLFGSVLLGGVIHLIDLSTDSLRLMRVLGVLATISVATLTARAGYGLFASFLVGYALTLPGTLHRWIVDLLPRVGGHILEAVLGLVWLLWRETHIFLLISTMGYGIGSLWFSREEGEGTISWILPRIILGLVVVGLLWYISDFFSLAYRRGP